MKKTSKEKSSNKKKQVRDFVEWFGSKPFSYAQIVEETGFDQDVVRVYVNELRKQGIVKEVMKEGKRKYFVKTSN